MLDVARANFPILAADRPGEIGSESDKRLLGAFVGKRVPPRRRGDMSSFRYLDPTSPEQAVP